MPPQVIIVHGRLIGSDLFWQVYRKKRAFTNLYLMAVMDGKDSTELSIIEKFLFSKSGAVVNEVSFR
jgi:hypothetical protein